MGNEIVNRLICGDNLNALDDLIKEGVKVDLIYLDPLFFSNRRREFQGQVGRRGQCLC